MSCGTITSPVFSRQSITNGRTLSPNWCLNWKVNNCHFLSTKTLFWFMRVSLRLFVSFCFWFLLISIEKTYNETVELIGKAYTSIFEDRVCEMLNQTPDVIDELCKNFEWEIQAGEYPRLILPRRPLIAKVPTESSENLLAKLTDFVSFLENWVWRIPKKKSFFLLLLNNTVYKKILKIIILTNPYNQIFHLTCGYCWYLNKNFV